MRWRSKKIFWATLAAVLAIAATPSVVLLESFQRYYRFLVGFEPADPLRPRQVNFIPHEKGLKGEPPEVSLEFVEFKLSAPSAKRVYLTGDFTRWRAQALALAKQSGGLWEIMVPLPQGRYHYLFEVDGKMVLDPKNPAAEGSGATGESDRKASVKVVR